MPIYDKLVINKFINGSFTGFKGNYRDLEEVMEHMISYVEKLTIYSVLTYGQERYTTGSKVSA